jgi:hypothetical protein
VGWIAPLAKGPRIYRALYVAGYAAVKSVDPNAQVLFGETSPYSIKGHATAPLAFLRGVVCADRSWHPHCGGLKTDGYAHHPYDFAHPPAYRYPGADNVTLSGLSRLTGALDKLSRYGGLTNASGGPINLYLTEDGYFASGKYRVSAKTQASRLQQAFEMAARNPRVVEMLQYLLVQPTHSYAFFNTSIASRGGKPRPAFTALARWAAKAVQAGRIAATPVRHNPPPPPPNGGSPSSPPPPPPCAYPRLPDGTCPPLPPPPVS